MINFIKSLFNTPTVQSAHINTSRFNRVVNRTARSYRDQYTFNNPANHRVY